MKSVGGLTSLDALKNLLQIDKLKTLGLDFGKWAGLGSSGAALKHDPWPAHTIGDPDLPVVLSDLGLQPNLSLPSQWPLVSKGLTTAASNTADNEFMCLIANRDTNFAGLDAIYGTGFHIGGGWILTAHHVLPDIEFLANQRAFFLKNSTFVSQEFSTDAVCFHASVDGIYAENGYQYEFDYAVAKLATPLSLELFASAGALTKDQRIDILRPVRKGNSVKEPIHGFGIVRSKPSFGGTEPLDRVKILDDKLIFHTCSAYPGDSGAPIINATGEVVGIHTHGLQRDSGLGSKTEFNWGTSIRAIAKDLQQRAENIFQQCTALHSVK